MTIKITKIRRLFLTFTGLAALGVTGLTTPASGADLGETLKEANWGNLIGTWVDSATKGERVKIVYAWKFENKVIEVNSTMGESKGVSLMGINADTGEVFMMGANSKGGASLGKWTMEGEDAVLELSYVGPNGEKGTMTFKHHRIDNDTVEVSGESEESGQPFSLTLVRAK
jgi:hypothetical protein